MSDRERYEAALHAMQSAVAMLVGFGAKELTPKHLRVGVNSALVDSAALARLLMDKGIFTKEEYIKYLADEAEREVERYKNSVQRMYGYRIDFK